MKARTLIGGHDDGLRRQGKLSEAAGCKGHYFKCSPISSEWSIMGGDRYSPFCAYHQDTWER